MGYDGSFVEFKSTNQEGPFSFSAPQVSLMMTPRMADVAQMLDITPDKIVEGNTILGVEGTMKAGSSSSSIVTYKDINTMQADKTQPDGTICIVGMYDVDISEATTASNIGLIRLPEIIPVSELSIEASGTSLNFGYQPLVLSATSILTYKEYPGAEELEEIIWYTVEGENYIRNHDYSGLMRMTDISSNGTTGNITISSEAIATGIYNHIGLVSTGQTQLYIYNAGNSYWNHLPNTYYTYASDIASGKTAYTVLGATKGTLTV